MALGRAVANSLTAAVLALLVFALIIPAGGCGQKQEGQTAQETAQVQEQAEQPTATPADRPAEAPPQEVADTAEGEAVVKSGSRVTLQYRGTLADGSVFDQSSPDRPLVFTAGIGQVIPGFDKGVMGMRLNEEKTITIPAAEAYGLANPKMIRNVPKSNFADDFNPQTGDEITIRNAMGRALRGRLVSTSSDSLLIDFNHPLAGKDLTFDLKIIGID